MHRSSANCQLRAGYGQILPGIKDIAENAIWTLVASVLFPILMNDSWLSELLAPSSYRVCVPLNCPKVKVSTCNLPTLQGHTDRWIFGQIVDLATVI